MMPQTPPTLYTDADIRAALDAERAEWRKTRTEWPSAEESVRTILDAAAPAIAARAWTKGFDRGFYDPLAGGSRDASESNAVNPYCADEIEAGA